MKVDSHLRTTAPHVFAAGDVTGRLLLVPAALQEGYVAATNAVCGPTMAAGEPVTPTGSFTDPEYAQVGLTEAKAREAHDVVTAVVRFDSTTRTIIDGRTAGFCKLVVDRATSRVLGCHVVGERAVEIAQVASIVDRGGHAGLGARPRAALLSDLRGDPRPGGRGRRPRDRAVVGPAVGRGGRDSDMNPKPESPEQGETR